MRKFQVGDLVRIVGYQDGLMHMKEQLGRVVPIDALCEVGKNGRWYHAIGWSWREDWLEPAYTRESIEELL